MPTDQERIAAFDACTKKVDQKNNLLGLGFIVDLLQGDAPNAAVDWGQMVIDSAKNSQDCMQLLTPAQRQMVEKQAAAAHQAYLDDFRELPGEGWAER